MSLLLFFERYRSIKAQNLYVRGTIDIAFCYDYICNWSRFPVL
ncbi:hypothetical protein VCR4J2_560072 [Vibrio coralliirubri]|nr:hypothetical protein VCR4J2_560072 [Vibrio coralliirubri]